MTRTRIRRLRFVFLLLTSSAVPVSAQQPILSEGQRVRITTPTLKKAVGIVSSSTTDSLTILSASGGGRTTVSTRDLEKLEVSAGKNAVTGAKKGAKWGGVLGAVAGLVFLAAPCNVPVNTTLDCSSSTKASYATTALGSGLLYGIAIGALVKAEKWDPANLQSRVTLSRDRVGLTMNIPGW
ncbi:MAG: hypothetical protein ABIZ36_07710 [Gemmatimonadaceae bacterium]